eukprot:gnl/MRDRNA2_/MRDRNA2_261993_c0_seq1.p1 gnl/MRDRNA2_/MRDRNA2_261993_c0~~gnl/MRDRNA2_/MRDRNA2_261993_c0_seq1.p1  ORF type:complete len:197 (-),score=36.33 gnl/MRDRNA2_/MRDRNA2_261993_c0_seq1:3-509(-)
MVFEWRWGIAYLGALATGDEGTAAKLRSEFVAFSVRQTVLDCRRGRLLCGPDFIPSLLLHMLKIVADTMDDWLAALKAAGAEFVPAENALVHPFWKWLEGMADPVHAARSALAKLAESKGLSWVESSKSDADILKWVGELGEKAMTDGCIVMSHHLGNRNINEARSKF